MSLRTRVLAQVVNETLLPGQPYSLRPLVRGSTNDGGTDARTRDSPPSEGDDADISATERTLSFEASTENDSSFPREYELEVVFAPSHDGWFAGKGLVTIGVSHSHPACG